MATPLCLHFEHDKLTHLKEMCGIFFSIQKSGENTEAESNLHKCKSFLQNRGPDLHSEKVVSLFQNFTAKFFGSVLWLQGSSPTLQPVEDENGNVLLWNGDIFNLEPAFDCLSDTAVIFQKLAKCLSPAKVSETLLEINGPFAFVFYSVDLESVFFGRDRFGRHSLLWNLAENDNFNSDVGNFSLSSIVTPGNVSWTEVPANGVYQLVRNKEKLEINQIFQWEKYNINSSLTDLPAVTLPTNEAFDVYTKTYIQELEIFERKLTEAVKVRLECQPLFCKNCIHLKLNKNITVNCRHPKTAVLFSGGLDSAVIAALVDRCLPIEEPIDLLNVAFEQKLINGKGLNSSYSVPDRITGLQALAELQKISPRRQWNFVQINVTIETLKAKRAEFISPLIFPLTTVLDDSIGCAQWFAARGKGFLESEDGSFTEYMSPARVILMGAGADEQLGGYARHRKRFQEGGWSSLCAELQMEMRRIAERNLGRDNRVISDHGRALRLPYLDENVVCFLSQLPVHLKADLRLSPGVGDKILLRCLATKLGLERTALEAKRAIQFGSRIAKAEGRNEKGSDVCTRLHAS